MKTIRWFLVLPGAFAATAIFQLFCAFMNWFAPPVLTQWACAWFGAMIFVACGAWIAPAYRRVTSIALHVIGVGIVAFALFGIQHSDGMANRVVQFALSIIGFTVGCLIVRAREKEDAELLRR